MSLRPWYNKDANYQTNAKSFMDYLARTNKFLEVLIEDYEIFQELVNEELETIKFDSEMAVDDILNNWLEDGTLARIINDGVLGNKADKSFVEDELKKVAAQLIQIETNVSKNTRVLGLTAHIDEFKKDDEVLVDDTILFERAFETLKNNGTLVLSPKTYHVELIELVLANNFKLIGNGATLEYIGSPEITQNLKDGTLLRIERSSNIKISDLNLKGRLFYGLDIDNLPIDKVENIYTLSDRHYGLYIVDSYDLNLHDINVEEFTNSIYSGGANYNIKMNGINIYNTFFGLQLYKTKDSLFNNINVFDARYFLSGYTPGDPVESIGARGTGILLDTVDNVTIKESNVERSGTDSFRVQGGSKNVTIENCMALFSRRHGFSVYNQGNEVLFNNCITKNTADISFWNGKDYLDTFKRPVNEVDGCSFVITSGNTVTLDSCKALEKTYTSLPIEKDQTQYYNSFVLNHLLEVQDGSKVLINNCVFKGHTSNELFIMRGTDSIITNNIFEGNETLTGLPIKTNAVVIYGRGNLINNNRVLYCYQGIRIIGNRTVITDNYILYSGDRSIYLVSGDSHFIDNNYMFHNGYNVTGTTPALQVLEGNDIVLGRNIGIDQREVKKMSYVYFINDDNDDVWNLTLGEPVQIGGITEVNDFNRDVVKNKSIGKSDFQALSQAETISGLKDEFNSLITKLIDADLMNNN